MMQRMQLDVSGRVQGVGYRHACIQRARALGLAGWVRNTDAGGVEVVAEGPRPALDLLADWCRRGPSGARVTGCRAEYGEARGGCLGFDARG